MKKILYSFIIFNHLFAITNYKWAVIGAGPAGITSVSILIENGIKPQEIAWIDPEFKVGRLGKYYGNVPSNQMASRFTKFFNSCQLFRGISSKAINTIKEYDQDKEPYLQLLVDALQDITEHLKPQVQCLHTSVQKLEKKDKRWHIICDEISIFSDKIILAHGSHPKRENLWDEKQIHLDIALDEKKLKKLINNDAIILVIGSAHSALLIVKYLAEFPIKQVVSLYTNPPFYGRYGGLEGITARWTKNVLEKENPKNVVRDKYSIEKFNYYAEKADKIVYAHGFEKNPMIINEFPLKNFDEKAGTIQPGLYGIGIAFPELYITNEGKRIPLIGVNSFMERAKELIPLWIKERL